MADMAKQRLVGALLVLSVIVITAFFLVKSANDQVEETQPIALPDNNLPIEAIEPELLEADPEVALDPHGLADEVAAVIEDKAVLEAIDIEAKAMQAASQKEQQITAKTNEAVQKIKQQPIQSTVKLPKPEAPKASVPVKEVKQAVVSESQPKVTQTKKVEPTGPKWDIQLASFSVKENALGLQSSVKRLGYESELQTIKNSQGKTIYRVRIGPVMDSSTVDSIVAKVKQHLRLQPQVIKR